MTDFSVRLKEAMSLRGFKQTDLALITNIDKSLISNYISGKYKPKSENLHLIALALDVSEVWLMGYDVSPNRSEPNAEQERVIDKEYITLFNKLSTSQKELVIALIKGISNE